MTSTEGIQKPNGCGEDIPDMPHSVQKPSLTTETEALKLMTFQSIFNYILSNSEVFRDI